MFLKAMSYLQDSGDHADLAITCGTEVFKVHKAVVCSQSEFFRLACRNFTGSKGDCKEGKTGIVEIPCRSIMTDSKDFIWDTDAEELKSVKHMIHYLYHLDYLEVETAKLKETERDDEDFDKAYPLKEGILIEHAKMYAMGEKYGIPGLKELAMKKYEQAYKHTSAGFASSMTVVFTSTVDSDRDLRDIIVNILHKDLSDLMRKPEIEQNIREFPMLAHSLLRKKLKLWFDHRKVMKKQTRALVYS